ncbi:MAG: MBL fold metallo-hydrolase [Candidatus Omnitrophota bacterium]
MSKITVTILGTTAGVPTKKRAHTAIHICHDDAEEFCCLFDCGENAQRQLLLAGLNLMKLDNVFLTHWHGDHCLGLPGLVDTMGFEGREHPLTIYAPEARKVRLCLGFNSSMGKFRVIPRSVPSRGKIEKIVFETKRFRIISVPVAHGVPAVAYALIEKDKTGIDPEKAKALGLPGKGEIYKELKKKGEITEGGRRITLEEVSCRAKGKKIVFSGDTEICDNLKSFVQGADLLIQDCTYFDEMGPDKPYKHASLPEVAKMVSSANVKKTVLTHISRKYQDTENLKELIRERLDLEVAEDFMTVTL